MESFLAYVSKDERDLSMHPLEGDDLTDYQEKQWSDFLERFDCRTIHKKEDRQNIIIELAHKDMVQIAQFITDNWRKPFKKTLKIAMYFLQWSLWRKSTKMHDQQ